MRLRQRLYCLVKCLRSRGMRTEHKVRSGNKNEEKQNILRLSLLLLNKPHICFDGTPYSVFCTHNIVYRVHQIVHSYGLHMVMYPWFFHLTYIYENTNRKQLFSVAIPFTIRSWHLGPFFRPLASDRCAAHIQQTVYKIYFSFINECNMVTANSKFQFHFGNERASKSNWQRRKSPISFPFAPFAPFAASLSQLLRAKQSNQN